MQLMYHTYAGYDSDGKHYLENPIYTNPHGTSINEMIKQIEHMSFWMSWGDYDPEPYEKIDIMLVVEDRTKMLIAKYRKNVWDVLRDDRQ